ncbi:MAG: sensor histidine kinase [Gemmatimonadota bacterium]
MTALAAALRASLGWQRIAFTLAICVLVSTQAFFQPTLYSPFDAEGLIRTWLDYAGECLLMSVPIMVAISTAEVLLDGVRRAWALPLLALALFAGATAGALLLIPYYDSPAEWAFDGRFVSGVAYWSLIATGIVMIYALQQSAARAEAAAHQAQVDRIAFSKQMMEAQLQVMRAQIEPHFLFNTLANVKRLAHTDVGSGAAMLDNLVRYLRAALPRMREEHATLGQEADLAQAYLDVLRIRMGERLRFSIDVPSALRAQPFPPMMLLTLVENAIKHGLNPSPQGGTLSVRATRHPQGLVLAVADTGVGFGGTAAGGTGVGLANTRARLGALYGDAGSLELAPNEPSGVVASVRIPFDTAAEDGAGTVDDERVR